MRKYFYILFLIISAFACEDREPEPIIVPGWIKPQLIALEDSGECNGCQVQRWTYNEEYFYHLYCSYWSCLNCNVYRHDGTLVEWGEMIDPVDFEANKHRPVLIWECGDELD